MDKNGRTDYDIELIKRCDRAAKFLEMDTIDFMNLPIPLGEAMITARAKNLNESLYKYQKNHEIDNFTKERSYGHDALVEVVNALFGGKEKTNEPKGAQNISTMRNKR
ncbi:MAG: hypothetical protein IJ772_04520 [Bacilli bacterium]|nr:hypothetical protein [Bacilli bacterium]